MEIHAHELLEKSTEEEPEGSLPGCGAGWGSCPPLLASCRHRSPLLLQPPVPPLRQRACQTPAERPAKSRHKRAKRAFSSHPQNTTLVPLLLRSSCGGAFSSLIHAILKAMLLCHVYPRRGVTAYRPHPFGLNILKTTLNPRPFPRRVYTSFQAARTDPVTPILLPFQNAPSRGT